MSGFANKRSPKNERQRHSARLKESVKNPHPDRRQKFDWTKLPFWPKGTKIIVDERVVLGDMTRIAMTSGKYWSQKFWADEDGFKALAPHLEFVSTETEPLSDADKMELLAEALEKIQALAHEGTARADHEVRVEIEALASAALAKIKAAQ